MQTDSKQVIDNLKTTYKVLNKNNLQILRELYHEEVTFIDPFRKVQGIDDLMQYFKEIYCNVSSVEFIFDEIISHSKKFSVTWMMNFQHPKIKSNQQISVYGCSHIKYASNKKIIYHCDYYDVGGMLYEHIPLLGRLIKRIKGKV